MRTLSYRKYLLGLLTAILAYNYTDRLALGLAVQGIKSDLHLTDTQLGLLSGMAFAAFYATAGLPIGRWADRGNRVTVVTVTTAVWSGMVALTGMARSFLQLVLVRALVGIGEAGCQPVAFSLLSDHFSREELPGAQAIYGAGSYASVIFGYFFAGWLNEIYGWRIMFAIVGIPGVLFALLAAFTMREPRMEGQRRRGLSKERLGNATQQAPRTDAPSLSRALGDLSSNVTFRHLLFACTVNFLFGYGTLQWQPAFFVRSFGLNTGFLGTWLTITAGGGGVIGALLGGHWASRYARRNERLQLRVIAVTLAMSAPLYVLLYMSADYKEAFILNFVVNAVVGVGSGPLFSAMQAVVPQRVHALSISIIYLCGNLIGMGLGPLAVGVLSDSLHPVVGQESLRYALVAISPGFLWGSWHTWRAAATVHFGIEEASERDSGRGEASVRV